MGCGCRARTVCGVGRKEDDPQCGVCDIVKKRLSL